jgi:hypothetical protein
MRSARYFGRGHPPVPMPGQNARSFPIAAVESQHLPSADVLKAFDDERAVRRLRRRLRFWRLLRRVR